MIQSPPSSAAYQSARRFIGRRASVCRKHGDSGQLHHVNRMGGLVCSACNPPRTDADCVLRLVSVCGKWDDADNPFELGQKPEAVARSGTAAPRQGSGTAAAGSNSATKFDEATTSELATSRDSAERRTSRRVGEPLLDLELDFYFNLPSSSNAGWLGPEVISAKAFDEVVKKEEEEEREKGTGLPELGVQKSGMESGFVRSGTCADVPHNNDRALSAKPQFAVGQVVRLMRRLETFRGTMSPGDGYVVSSAGVDSHGATVVALSRGGAVLVSGLIPDSATLAVLAMCGETSVGDLIG